MSDIDITTTHLNSSRADAARHARDVLLDAARAWVGAPKNHVGAVALPADGAAARAFAVLFRARSDLAYHVGGEAAALVTAAALGEVSDEDGGEV
ncbi:MAG: hypothetical protein M3314_12515 [Actinomycetota bacterium]|nr:hypothetical protein [Actinomycetota bacterium]